MTSTDSPLVAAGACTRPRAGVAHVASFGPTFWFAGWLFTLGYAKVAGWKILLGFFVWPYLLGTSLR